MEQLSEAIGRHVNLTRKGSEHVGICPFHDDTSASLQVNDKKNVWKCFVCGTGGKNAESFLTKFLNISFSDARAQLNGTTEKPRKISVTYTPIIPVPDNVPLPSIPRATSIWQYRDENNRLESLVVRHDPNGQKKIIYPMTYCSDGVISQWVKQAPPTRQLYNRHELAKRPNEYVLLVEGEKAADAAKKLCPDMVVTTWHGGVEAIHQVNWRPLTGRRVILWPDNDIAGQVCMNGGFLKDRRIKGIAEYLTELSCTLRVLKIHPSLPPKGDAADLSLTPAEFKTWMTPETMLMPEEVAPPAPPPTPPTEDDLPFRIMGFLKSGDAPAYVFYAKATKMLHIFKAANLTTTNLMTLAPLNYWEQTFPSSKTKLDINAAVNYLIQKATARGIFDPTRVRGRGAWLDNNRVVIHAGKHLIVNGIVTPLSTFTSDYIYEQSRELQLSTTDPLAASESRKLLTLLNRFNWERRANGYLLAGWCVIAPICGVLSWRPHLWLTGAAGTGKTTVYRTIMRKLIGSCALAVQGDTTAAGIRQALQHDAVPVLFDEAEGDSASDQQRMQNILIAIRGASSSDSGQVIKGSGAGNHMTYELQSMFAFSSISPQLKQQADRRRTTILSLTRDRSEGAETRWKQLAAEINGLITTAYCNRLQARTIRMIHVIMQNIDTFKAAATEVIGDINMGDQLAPILAGAFILRQDEPATIEQARDFMRENDWSEETSLDESKDELRLRAYILESIIEVEDQHGRHHKSIQEICDDAIRGSLDAQKRLLRLGIKTQSEISGAKSLIISNSNTQLARLLRDTPWQTSYSKILTRLPNSQKIDSTRFGANTSRAVKIPFTSAEHTPSALEIDSDAPF
jgi:putative DNA primase/helicase